MPGLYPGPFNEFKLKVLKFFSCCQVRCKMTEETSGLHQLKCLPRAIQQIKIKIVEAF